MIPHFGPATPVVLIDFGLIALVWLLAFIAGISLFFNSSHFLNRALCFLVPVFLGLAWLPVFRMMSSDWSNRSFWFALLCLPLPAVILTFAFRAWSSHAVCLRAHGSKEVWWLNRPFMGVGALIILPVCLYATVAALIAFLY
jgi:hypothetical protein